MREPTWTIAATVALLVVVTACGGASEGDVTTTFSAVSEQTTSTIATTDTSVTNATDTTAGGDIDEASITIENFSFSGATSVAVGTTVTVTNEDGVTHTWTSEDDVWDSGAISEGDSFELTFEEPGEFPYFCAIHPTMEGTITVEG